jgi:ribosome-binding protein aMBF1 (putative translation factor)
VALGVRLKKSQKDKSWKGAAREWSAADLAKESALAANTIRRAEVAEHGTSLTVANELAVRRALEGY